VARPGGGGGGGQHITAAQLTRRPFGLLFDLLLLCLLCLLCFACLLPTTHAGSSPGYVEAFGSHAAMVVDFGNGAGGMIGAARLGAGFVVLLGDHQALSTATAAATGVLLQNTFAFGTGVPAASVTSLGVTTTISAVQTLLIGMGHTNVTTFAWGDHHAASPFASPDTRVFLGGRLSGTSAAQQDWVWEYVVRGGVVVLSDYGIGYDWWWGGSPVANDVLLSAGLGYLRKWPTSYTGVMSMGDKAIRSTRKPPTFKVCGCATTLLLLCLCLCVWPCVCVCACVWQACAWGRWGVTFTFTLTLTLTCLLHLACCPAAVHPRDPALRRHGHRGRRESVRHRYDRPLRDRTAFVPPCAADGPRALDTRAHPTSHARQPRV